MNSQTYILESKRTLYVTLSPSQRGLAIGIVLLVHGLLVWGLWSSRSRSDVPVTPLFVSLIQIPKHALPQVVATPVKPEPPVATPRPQPAPIINNTPADSAQDFVAAPVTTRQVEPQPVANDQPVSLPELAVTCPGRIAPHYPVQAKRMGQQGRVLLQVFLDASGRVTQAVVQQSSGVAALDQAALTSVQQWQCQPALRDGQPVAAVALQLFNFNLRRN